MGLKQNLGKVKLQYHQWCMGLQEHCCQLLLCTVSLACVLGFLALLPKFIQ